MPNKTNSLGQSKASLRSVLPAGDLQRWGGLGKAADRLAS